MFDINTVLFYGITFGILIMSILYTFIRYLYSKEIFYISYCFMQIFSLVYIGSYSKLFEISFFIQEMALSLEGGIGGVCRSGAECYPECGQCPDQSPKDNADKKWLPHREKPKSLGKKQRRIHADTQRPHHCSPNGTVVR